MIRSDKQGFQVTHRPTGIRVFVDRRNTGSLQKARSLAIKVVKSMVQWGKLEQSAVIRKYDLDGPAGTFIRDLHTGQLITGDEVQQILDRGLVEKFKRPN